SGHARARHLGRRLASARFRFFHQSGIPPVAPGAKHQARHLAGNGQRCPSVNRAACFPPDTLPRYFLWNPYTRLERACWLNQIRKKSLPSRIPFFIPGPFLASPPWWFASSSFHAGRKIATSKGTPGKSKLGNKGSRIA